MTPCSELARLFDQPFPPITAPVSLADAAQAEAHMNQHEAVEGVCAEGDCDDQ